MLLNRYDQGFWVWPRYAQRPEIALPDLLAAPPPGGRLLVRNEAADIAEAIATLLDGRLRLYRRALVCRSPWLTWMGHGKWEQVTVETTKIVSALISPSGGSGVPQVIEAWSQRRFHGADLSTGLDLHWGSSSDNVLAVSAILADLLATDLPQSAPPQPFWSHRERLL